MIFVAKFTTRSPPPVRTFTARSTEGVTKIGRQYNFKRRRARYGWPRGDPVLPATHRVSSEDGTEAARVLSGFS